MLAVNKIDLVEFDRTPSIERIVAAYDEAFAGHYGFASRVAIPISARFGDNVSFQSERTPWYHGDRR